MQNDIKSFKQQMIFVISTTSKYINMLHLDIDSEFPLLNSRILQVFTRMPNEHEASNDINILTYNPRNGALITSRSHGKVTNVVICPPCADDMSNVIDIACYIQMVIRLALRECQSKLVVMPFHKDEMISTFCLVHAIVSYNNACQMSYIDKKTIYMPGSYPRHTEFSNTCVDILSNKLLDNYGFSSNMNNDTYYIRQMASFLVK